MQASKIPAAVHAAAAGVLALALWGAIANYDQESAFQSQTRNRDPYLIQASEDRFAGLRQAVPESVVLGFLTDASGTLASVLFGSAQYALAPRLLEMDTKPDLVLGDFSRPADFAGLGGKLGLRIQHDFGNGVILYYRPQE